MSIQLFRLPTQSKRSYHFSKIFKQMSTHYLSLLLNKHSFCSYNLCRVKMFRSCCTFKKIVSRERINVEWKST